MPALTIEQIADGVTEILNARAHGAQRAQREAESLRVAESQRADEAARAAQITAIRGEFAHLCDRERTLKAEIDFKFEKLGPLQRELNILGSRHSHLLAERARMQQHYPFLK